MATSVIFLHEVMTIWLIAGLVLIIVGIYLANRKVRRNVVVANLQDGHQVEPEL